MKRAKKIITEGRDDIRDLVGGKRAKAIITFEDGTPIAQDDPEATWLMSEDTQGCHHAAPLFGADHWSSRCPCRPIVQENGVIQHRVEN